MDRTDSQSSLKPTEMKAQAFASSWYKLETSVVLDISVYTTGTKLEGLIQVISISLPFPMPYTDFPYTQTCILHMPYNLFPCHSFSRHV